MGNWFSSIRELIMDAAFMGAFNHRRIRPHPVAGQNTDGKMTLYRCKYRWWAHLLGWGLSVAAICLMIGIYLIIDGSLTAGITCIVFAIAEIICYRRFCHPVDTYQRVLVLSPEGLTCFTSAGERSIPWKRFLDAQAHYSNYGAVGYLTVKAASPDGAGKAETVTVNGTTRYSFEEMAGLIVQYAAKYKKYDETDRTSDGEIEESWHACR